MPDWKTLSTKILHSTHWVSLVEDKVHNQNGKELTYTYLTKNPSVAIIVINKQSEIFLQRQFIYPIKKSLWCIPGGFCDDNEQPIESAKRELAEETGINTAAWEYLGTYYNSPGISHNISYVFLASVENPSISVIDEDEDLSSQKFVSINDAKRMLAGREIVDGFSMTPLYWYIERVGG